MIGCVLLFFRPVKEIYTHIRTLKTLRPMLRAISLKAERQLSRDTAAMTLDLGLHGLIKRTTPFYFLLRQSTRGTENLF